MGTELLYVVVLGGFLAFLANVCYMLGGTQGMPGGKLWRRYAASFLLTFSVNLTGILILRWAWQYLLIWPLLTVAFHLGYGADTVAGKIARRSIYALAVSSVCFIGLWATGFTVMGWVICGLSIGAGAVSIFLGVINPYTNARVEEFLVCQVLNLFIPFWPFIG